jgi:copper chaperone CopZ
MKTTVKIPGMHCNACATLITEVSEEFPAVHGVNVDLDSKEVTLDHDENLDLTAWTKEIESLGTDYKVFNQ